MNWTKTLYTLVFACFYAFVIGIGQAQSVINSLKLKDYSLDDGIYPYVLLDNETAAYGVTHPPAVRISESEFIYIWQSKKRFREREIVCFDLLLNKKWETVVKLRHDEEIFHTYHTEKQLIILSSFYQHRGRLHNIAVRSYDLESGEIVADSFIYTTAGPVRMPLAFSSSADGEKFLIYHFPDPQNRLKSRYDFWYKDMDMGYRISNTKSMQYSIFSKELKLLKIGKIPMETNRQNATQIIDCQIDNAGNIFSSFYTKPNILEVRKLSFADEKLETLRYDSYPDPWGVQAPYTAQLPPVLGEEDVVYFACSSREKEKGRWHTKSFQVIAFDFKNLKLDLSRKAGIDSKFVMHLGKSRELAGLKPKNAFDGYLIREIIPMPDGRLWLMTQRYEARQMDRLQGPDLNFTTELTSRAEEIVLFEFDAEGKAKGAIMIPLKQYASTEREMVARFYQKSFDRETGLLHLVTREATGDKSRKPARIFYRKIDLVDGVSSERKLLYEGKRRDQFFIKPYTLLLNSNLAVMMVIDGADEHHPKIVSVNLE